MAVLLAAGMLVACGDDDEQPDATATTGGASAETTTTVRAAATTTSTARPTTTLPDSGPVLVESTVYPYALTLLAEEFLRPFQPATVAWNGASQVIRGIPILDVFALSDGFVHVVGLEWPDDLQSFAQMFVDHGVRHNSCSQAQNQREVAIAGEPALVFTVDSCGFTGENLTFARLAALHDGFGLIAFTPTLVGQESVDMERLVARFSGIEWRTG